MKAGHLPRQLAAGVGVRDQAARRMGSTGRRRSLSKNRTDNAQAVTFRDRRSHLPRVAPAPGVDVVPAPPRPPPHGPPCATWHDNDCEAPRRELERAAVSAPDTATKRNEPSRGPRGCRRAGGSSSRGIPRTGGGGLPGAARRSSGALRRPNVAVGAVRPPGLALVLRLVVPALDRGEGEADPELAPQVWRHDSRLAGDAFGSPKEDDQ